METETISTSISTEIRSANDKFEAAIERGDAAGMAGLYTEDGMLLPAGSDIIAGKVHIQEFWQGAMNMGVKHAELRSAEIEQHGDTAIELGNYVLKGEGDQQLDKGKYIVIWKKQQDGWKLQKDIWNSSLSAG